MPNIANVCCLCNKTATDNDPITREHVPPKQFYPKSMRDGLNLWTVPTHRSCNNAHKSNEEYFYHALFPLVDNENPNMSCKIFNDLKRRSKKPQTRKLLRKILNTECHTSKNGIFLPPTLIRLDIDMFRVEQVAIKIGRCLFYRDHKRYMPYDNCKDIRLCEREKDVPELYQLSWELSKVNVLDPSALKLKEIVIAPNNKNGLPLSACHQVFSYRTAYLESKKIHLYTLFFWEAFMLCMTFNDPIN